jgi:hypothetical protein
MSIAIIEMTNNLNSSNSIKLISILFCGIILAVCLRNAYTRWNLAKKAKELGITAGAPIVETA